MYRARDTKLDRDVALKVDESLPIARQMAEALEAAHGFIHGNLKPTNVKVKADGMVKVLDFGLAKSLQLGARSRSPQEQGGFQWLESREKWSRRPAST